MRTYSLHFIYRAIFLAALLFWTSYCISMISDLSQAYSISKLFIFVVRWSLCGYAWYILFTTVYKIEILDGSITAKSLSKTINFRGNEIKEVRDYPLFLRIHHDDGWLRIPYQIDGVADVKNTFNVSRTYATSSAEKTTLEAKWLTPRLLILIILILAYPLIFFWSFFSQMEGGALYKLAELLRRSQVEILLQTRFYPLTYILLVFITIVSIMDMLLLILLKILNIDSTNNYLRPYSGGIFWKDLEMRIGVVWGIVLLDQAVLTASIRSVLPLAAILGVCFLFSTVRSAIRKRYFD